MHERISIHPVCFAGASFPDLAENWRKVGAHRVGLLSRYLESDGLPAVEAAIATGGYRVETINHVFLPFGQHLAPNKNLWHEPRERLSRAIQGAKSLGAKSIYVMTGGHGTLTWEEAADCFAAAIAPCVTEAKTASIVLMVENASPLYADIHLAHSLRDALTLAEIAEIGVCIDVFSCWTEAGLRDTIHRAMPRCNLFQVCDYIYGDRSLPARAVPGDGTIPVERLIAWALDAGYNGAFDLELLGPRIDEEGHVAATRRAADRLGKILQSLRA